MELPAREMRRWGEGILDGDQSFVRTLFGVGSSVTETWLRIYILIFLALRMAQTIESPQKPPLPPPFKVLEFN